MRAEAFTFLCIEAPCLSSPIITLRAHTDWLDCMETPSQTWSHLQQVRSADATVSIFSWHSDVALVSISITDLSSSHILKKSAGQRPRLGASLQLPQLNPSSGFL